MSVKIRLSRGGAKKRPYYYVVVAHGSSPRDGRYIEQIGTFDPMLKKDDAEPREAQRRARQALALGRRTADGSRAPPARRRRPRQAHASNNPEKAKPKKKAQERAAAAAEKAAKAAEAAPPADAA